MDAFVLRACVLSGGLSRRMGRDKALLAHPRGGVWLTVLVSVLQELGLPVVVVTRHASHASVLKSCADVAVLLEPEPWDGPLMALSKVLSEQDGSPLLLCPVDMPLLRPAILRTLMDAWRTHPDRLVVADDGSGLMPLLAIIPSGPLYTDALQHFLASGQRRWQTWLTSVPHRRVRLPAVPLRNLNEPADLDALRVDSGR